MHVLANWLLEPLSIVFTALLIALAAWIFSAPRSAWLGIWLTAAMSLLWVFSAPITANGWVKLIEKPADDKKLCSTISSNLPVVILGASLDAYTESNNPYRVLSRDSLLRTFRAVDFDNGINRFYVLGGGKTSRKLSDYMAQVLHDSGISDARVTRESQSLSTIDNARNLRALWPDDQESAITLITSALHLNRATATFEAQGFTIECAVGAGSLYSISAGWVGFLPFVHSLEKSSDATREWLATWLYRWRGYTNGSASG